MDRAVRAHRQAIAQMRLRICGRDRCDDDFGRDAFFAQPQRLFERDIVERVGRQLDAVGDDAGAVRLDLDAYVEIDNTLVADQNFHRTSDSLA